MENNPFRVLLAYKNNKIDEEYACKTLGKSPRTLRQLDTLWTEEQLRLVAPLVDRLMEPVNTKNDVRKMKDKLAEVTGTTYREVNRLLSRWNIPVAEPIKSQMRREVHIKARSRITSRQKYALDVIAGLADATYAAEMAATTRRHIYRICGDMLSTHGQVFRDLRRMGPSQRKHLADQIEKELFNVS